MVLADDPLPSRYPGAELLLRIAVWRAFWKLPALCADHTFRHGFGPCSAGWDLAAPPQWKTRPVWSEVLPAAEPARLVKPDSGVA